MGIKVATSSPLWGRLYFGGLLFLGYSTSVQSQEGGYQDSFRLHILSMQATFSACAVFDIDHDGDADIIAGAFWYENPTWEKHFVADVEVINGRPDGYSHLPMDINRDGWTDVLHCNFRSKSIYWLEHPGAELGEWKKHVVDVPGPMETGRLYDIDRDGQLDVLPNGWYFNAWYALSQPPGETSKFIRYDIGEHGIGHGNGFGDLNGDGRGDYVGIQGWYEAPEDPRTQPWIWHPEFDLGRTSIPIIVADPDEDGDADLIYALGHDYGVFWVEQNQDGEGKRIWTKHLIDSTWSQGHSPLWVDLDLNGRPEFVNGKRFWAHEGRDPGARDSIVIYSYEFEPQTGKFRRRTIQKNGPASVGLDPKAFDLDQDGDLDLIFSGRTGIFWYENLVNQKLK